ncbi:unnamed protein product [Acidithrix sp. C25]|nr:unnamed protein product [Acidithrix sp. C25]
MWNHKYPKEGFRNRQCFNPAILDASTNVNIFLPDRSLRQL